MGNQREPSRNSNTEDGRASVHAEVEDRFGVLPNFFRLAPDSPEIAENLWGFAKFGYLDNPLPSLFKERLFVYLSQFCDVRYCIARHVGFLVGLGRPAGDLKAEPETVEQIVRLLQRPIPTGEELQAYREFCESHETPLENIPGAESEAERAIFACATHVFRQTSEASKCLDALRWILGPVLSQHLLVFLTFVQTAHFWTRVHPELRTEHDIEHLLNIHEALASCVLQNPEAEDETAQLIVRELEELRRERDEAELLSVTLASIGDAVIATDAQGNVTRVNRVAERLTGWSSEEAVGKQLSTVFRIVNQSTRKTVENPALRALRDGTIVGLANHTILIARDGSERYIDDSAAPIQNEQGDILGAVLVFRDISEKYQAEAKLRESELRYRLVGQAANDAIWDWDLATNQVTWNEGLQTRFHFTADQIDSDAQWWIDHIHPGDRDRIAQHIHAAIDGGEGLWQNQYRFQRADGTYASVFDRGRIVHDDDGNPTRMVGSMLDLTEKLKTESELREARSRLESTLAAAEVGTWEFDPIRNTVKSDSNLARMFGVTEEEEKTGFLEFYLKAIHPDDKERVSKTIQKALAEDDTYETEYRLLHSEGGLRWVVARGRVERDETGRAIRLPGVVVDISERKRAERALQKSEQQLHLALDAGELGAWNVEPAIDQLVADERCRRILSGSSAPLTLEDAFATIHPEDQQRVRDAAEAATRPENPIPFAEEYRVVHANGDVRWIFGKGRATFEQTEQGPRVTTFDGTVMDVTRQRELREELQLVAARLSEADRRKDEFLATLAHELRNPLAPIRTGLEIMRLSQNDPETIEEIRVTMERQTQQLIALVDDLLDVSRITTGKLELRKCRVKLSDVIQSALESSQPFIVESGHELTVSKIEEEVYLEADPNRLVQVLSNLLNNSTKYTPEGGDIELAAVRQGSEVVLTVSDNGIGIPPDMLDHIFEMFAQIDRPEEKGYTGLGIGLSLVKSLVEMHDGRVEVHSDGPGQGSAFRVFLPVLEPAVDSELAAQSNSVSSSSGKLKVLVVDDNNAAATMLSIVVKMLGNEVMTAHDGQEAIDTGMQFRPHVILMDIGMPILNGYEAARRIRQLPWGENIQLIALTGWGQEEDRARTRDAGFDHHLVKPAEPSELQELLHTIDAQRLD